MYFALAVFFFSHREEIEKQKARVRYLKMHLAGKSDEAKADLARLAIIKKEREEAARKKEEEKKGRVTLEYVSVREYCVKCSICVSTSL